MGRSNFDEKNFKPDMETKDLNNPSRKALLKKLDEEILKWQRLRQRVKDECNHSSISISARRKDDGNLSFLGMRCDTCRHDFGWYCPANPKGYCEYEDSSEYCIYCDAPSERK